MNAGRLTTPKEKVQELQEKLGHAAKINRKRRFHALYDKVYRMDDNKDNITLRKEGSQLYSCFQRR